MSKLVWDQIGEHFYETGTKMGVLYTPSETDPYGVGEAWNGLSAVTESPSGAEATPIWADDIKYLSLLSAEQFGATVEAYTYPDSFEACDGSKEISKGVTIGQQPRTPFGLCYRTILGNDTMLDAYGYKLHLLYGCKAATSDKSYKTKSDSPEAALMSWTLDTTPVAVSGALPTASLTINSTKIPEVALKAIEDVLYGTETEEPRLPLPDEVKSIIDQATSGGTTE